MSHNKTEIYIIEQEHANQRIDAFLSGLYSDLSRSYIQKQIKNESVLVNNVPIKPSYVLKTDDNVKICFELQTEQIIEPQNIPLDIKYEDEYMIVVNKPSGMLTHPTSTEKTNTLVNALLYYTNGNLADCNGFMRPGIIHRLDRNTSGLLMVAKNNSAYEALKKQMQERTIEKKYYALVCGALKDDEGTIIENIGRHPSKPEKMAVTPDGKPSVTHYKVIERFQAHTLLDVTLETGRTHQIRVHMAYIKHPIVNDTMYGGSKLPVKTSEQVLQAYSLKFVSPADNSQKHITLDFDSDIIKTLNYLRSKK